MKNITGNDSLIIFSKKEKWRHETRGDGKLLVYAQVMKFISDKRMVVGQLNDVVSS